MQGPETKRQNDWLVLLVANDDEAQIDRTLMAAWSIRKHFRDLPIAVVTNRPTHRLWRTSVFNIVLSIADDTDANIAACCRRAMERGVADRAFYMNSHCRLRSDAVGSLMKSMTDADADVGLLPDGGTMDDGVVGLRNSPGGLAFLDHWSASLGEGGGLPRLPEGSGRYNVATLNDAWLPTVVTDPKMTPKIEIRQGNPQRLHAEMLVFALHRLVSGDLKRAATVYARVALRAEPDLVQLGAERLVQHLRQRFPEKVSGLTDDGLSKLDQMLGHAADEDPAGNLLAIAALHLEMDQPKTAVTVLRLISRMRFNKPVPLPE